MVREDYHHEYERDTKSLVELIRERHKALLEHLNEAEQRGRRLKDFVIRPNNASMLSDPVRIKNLGEISDHLHSMLIYLSSAEKTQPNAGLDKAPLYSLLDEIKDPETLSPESAWELSGRAQVEHTRLGDATHLYILLKAELESNGNNKTTSNMNFLRADLENLLCAYEEGEFGKTSARRKEARSFLLDLQQARHHEYRRDRAKMRIRSKYLRFAGILLSVSLLVFCALYIAASSLGYLSILLPLLAVSSGATGSVLSRAYKLSRQPLLASDKTNGGNDPPLGIRQLLANRIFWVQLVIGGTVGLALFLVFSGGLISLPGVDDDVAQNPTIAAIVGFLAGFSEPFSLGTLDRVAGQVSNSD